MFGKIFSFNNMGLLMLLSAASPFAQILDTALAGAGYRTQGEYYGSVGGKPYGIQVIDFSGGKFDMNILPGGLPGQGWGTNLKDFVYLKSTSNGANGTVFVGSGAAAGWNISIPTGGKTLSGTNPAGATVSMNKIYRSSPTLGMAPPAGAIALFDGTQASWTANWTGKALYTIGTEKYLSEGNNTTKPIADHTLHIEFRPPYEPDKDGQERGNSGVYVQGNYECQVLDSYGWMKGSQENGEHGSSDGWAGGIFAWSPPKFNMEHPPLTWQTYDIYVTNPTYNGNSKTGPAHLTVYHNGVMVQDTTVEGPTPGGDNESPQGGMLYVQNHGGPLWFKNVWVVKGKNWVPIPPMPSLGQAVALQQNRNVLMPMNRSGRFVTLLQAGALSGAVAGSALFNVQGSRLIEIGNASEHVLASGLYIMQGKQK